MKLAAPDTSRKPTIAIQPQRGLFDLDLRSVWAYREILFILVWRDIVVRYKQTILGVLWVILQPLITMVIFTLIFGSMANIASEGVPYPIFTYAALLPWSYFAQALSQSSNSVVNSSSLVTKVYFPRLLIPLAATAAPLVDLFFSFLVYLFLMVWFKVAPTWGLLALPLFLGLSVMTALAVGLWSSALNVRYRDVRHIFPFLIQVWMYAAPVVYPVSMVPEKWRLLYSLNPMVGVIEGFRWALLGAKPPDFMIMAVTLSVVTLLLAGGLVYFKRMEHTFADII